MEKQRTNSGLFLASTRKHSIYPPTGYRFPETCPFTVAQVLEDDFFPEGPTLELPPA